MRRRMTTTTKRATPTARSSPVIQVNRYFADHPEMVLGEHALRRGIYGPAPTYTCRPRKDGIGA